MLGRSAQLSRAECDKAMNVCPIGGSLVILMFFKCMASLTDLFLVSSTTSYPSPPTPLKSSWTEDTRSYIFSDAALHLGKDGRKPLAAELDMQIEQKFNEFDELVVTGRNLLDEEHHLTQMVSRVTHLPLTAIVEYIVGFIYFSAFTNPRVVSCR